MAERIQRKRTKGWRMPDGAIYVGRPSRWGNPFTVMNGHRQGWLVWDDRDRLGLWPQPTSNGYIASFDTPADARQFAVDRFRWWARVWGRMPSNSAWLSPLRGRDLACWCPLDSPCHADVLLELANAGEDTDA